MALTLPVYINVDTQTSAALVNGTARGELISTVAAAVDQGTVPITRGLIQGFRMTKSATAGAVIFKMFADAAGTDEIYNSTLTYTSPIVALSDGDLRIPFFSGLWWTVTGDGSNVGHTCAITFVIRSIAGNS